jgi:processive 1,2-diacylglycerol beta-glucosyltransferase
MNILVIHATAGAGHKKAAEAIYHGIQSKTAHRVTLVDALDYTNSFFKYSYPSFYTFLVSRMSWLWGFCFALLNIPLIQPLIRVVRRIYNGLNGNRLQSFLKKEQFDYIICTQFLSAEISAHLKRTGQIRSKVICVVTDFDVHRIWICEGVDIYVGACEYTKERLMSLGIPADRIVVSGIPTDPKFLKEYDQAMLRRQWGFKEKDVTVLLATGSFGFGPIEEIIDLLHDHQLVVVCGHNEALYDRLLQRQLPRVKVCGLVNNMDELMSGCDVMITKPGGLSIAEALVKGLALIFFSAIPGQETGNVRVLAKYGIGYGQRRIDEMAAIISRLAVSPQELITQRSKSKAFGKPQAVDTILQLLK